MPDIKNLDDVSNNNNRGTIYRFVILTLKLKKAWIADFGLIGEAVHHLKRISELITKYFINHFHCAGCISGMPSTIVSVRKEVRCL